MNAQPHAGAQANTAVYMACLKPGDTFMGMSLAHGGHLTHGHPLNVSGKLYRVVAYGVRKDTEVIDFDELLAIAEREKPKLIVAGASAYPRTLDFPKFRAIADAVGALLMVDMAHIAGLVATGLHPSPVGHAHFVTTTTHKTLRGPRAGLILCVPEWAKEIDRAVFPGQQGGPLEHVIAAKAVALQGSDGAGFHEVSEAGSSRTRESSRRPWPRRASGSSPAGPTTTSSSSTSGRRGSRGRCARRRSTPPGSP